MYKRMFYCLLALSCLVAAGCFGGWGGTSSSKDTGYKQNPPSSRKNQQASAPRAAPAAGGMNLFRLPMADGMPVTVKAPAVLFFYTSWCGYCKQVMPEFKNMTNRARAQGWRVYGVQVGEGPGQANAFINQYQPNFPVLVDQQSLVARQYGVKGYPTFVIIDENGNIVYNAHDLPRNF